MKSAKKIATPAKIALKNQVFLQGLHNIEKNCCRLHV